MNYIFMDCEMTGLDENSRLISVAFKCGEKRFYAEFNDFDTDSCSDWIKSNVIANLKFNDCYNTVRKDKNSLSIKNDYDYIEKALRKWFVDEIGDKSVLVADVGHYDIVLVYDLFGGAFNLPVNVSATYLDLNTLIALYENIDVDAAFDINREDYINFKGDNSTKHNAMFDTEICEMIFNKVNTKFNIPIN